ncbi:hypothetical protein ACLOJK_025101 [Asimina triloba]
MGGQRNRLSDALKKLLKARSFESPRSPTSTLVAFRLDDSSASSDCDNTTTSTSTKKKRLARSSSSPSQYCSSSSSSLPSDVRKGFFPVYVGEKRYVIPLHYLKHQVFRALLRRAEEEFGFSHTGAIRLPCDAVFFEHLLWLLNRQDPSVQDLEIEELLQFYQ